MHKRWVVMGVSGSGKSTVGAALAERLQVPFIEGDAFHSKANVDKMSHGVPLTDEDRAGWLLALRDQLRATIATHGGVVLACSSLKRGYRDVLREADAGLRFLHLTAPETMLAARVAGRTGHFMAPSLLASQLQILEPLQADEAGVTCPSSQAVDTLLDALAKSGAILGR
ncbi:gluconokinase [Zemynaea arenosa]|nr:gluconokinase [Massilia arenosa]